MVAVLFSPFFFLFSRSLLVSVLSYDLDGRYEVFRRSSRISRLTSSCHSSFHRRGSHDTVEYNITAGNFRPGRGADGCRATAVGRAFGRAYFRAMLAPQWHLVASTVATAATTADAANRRSTSTPGRPLTGFCFILYALLLLVSRPCAFSLLSLVPSFLCIYTYTFFLSISACIYAFSIDRYGIFVLVISESFLHELLFLRDRQFHDLIRYDSFAI